jgi:hypothetical protein
LNKKWNILFCDPEIKICPITDFIDSCRPEHQVKLLHFIKLLEEMGPNLPRPYADLLHDGIHELRIKLSGEQFRLLYFFCHECYIIFFEVLNKKSSRVPEKLISQSIKYRESVIKRSDKDRLEGFVKNFYSYIDYKLVHPDFREIYDDCNICKNTVEIIKKIYNNGYNKEHLAKLSNLTVNDLDKLEDAEKCTFEIIEKISIALELPVPQNCRKNFVKKDLEINL